MSGHSKWSTIKRQKGSNDAKRGQLFTKLSSAITIAVRQGGGIGEPSGNPRLRLAIEAARSANMPKDNIERAIQKAAGKEATDMIDVVYEGFGPGGVSLVVEAITDNKQRTTPEVKNFFDKHGGTLANPGSVSYMFERKAVLVLEKGKYSMDDIFLKAAESGASDIEEREEEVLVYTSPDKLEQVRGELEKSSLVVLSMDVILKPIVYKKIEDRVTGEKILAFISMLEEMDDVQTVFDNMEQGW